MWHLIRRVVKKTIATARHHTPTDYAQQLVDAWAEQSTPASLPIHIQDALASRAAVHRLRLMSALLQDDDDDAEEITEEELQDHLSPWLFGFLPQRSTRHCLVDQYSRLSRDSVMAFIDLRSAFDVANRDIILDQLVDFGIKDNLLRWIRGYLSNRTSRVFFTGALSPLYSFHLGISSNFLDSFSVASSHCGIIVSPDKSRIFTCRLPQARPVFTIGGTVIPMCSQYCYQGAPVNIWPIVPARPQDHPIVQDLLGRLQRRLTPLQWLSNNSSGISIPVARTIYIAFIRSVVDYVSPALIQLSRATLKTLEIFQNRAMRIILGCPMSTRIVNMQRELRLPPLIDRIYCNITCFTVKCLHFPHLSPHYSQLVRTSLRPNSPVPPILPAERTLIRSVSSMLRSLNIDIMVADFPPGPPPWMLPTPDVSFTPTSKSELPSLQRQLALEHIETVTSSITDPYCLYTDGSLQADLTAGCAIFSPDMESPPGGWTCPSFPL
ncbi:hypothetical protein Pcinc_006860 [Petrolisthes cinctipes]|uniref:Reverse transcriptase domain-containing protein n=1 Tax=Petrolisthes cinctipes TaxID=88211 RepID=A0AAE1KYR1_PETCI|nr:hypothetical protein Pcinc_006860 [Petrolisthes cinctipes]